MLGRCLFGFCDSFPAVKSTFRPWGLRTTGEDFGHRVGRIQFPDGRSFKLASISQNYLSFELFWRGGGYYEPITRLLVQDLVQPADTFVDIGANIGFYSLVVGSSCPGARVIAFEPNPTNFRLLTQNVRANALRNVHCEPSAISDVDATATLYLAGSQMSASLQRGFDGNVTGALDVPTTTLDTYLAQHPVNGRLVLKVDVEGHEEALFRGMPQTLGRLKPDIITEVTFNYSRDTSQRLASHGYRFFQITDRGLLESPVLTPVVRDRFVFLNYLLTTKPHAEIARSFARIEPAVRQIDLTQTSKYLSRADLERFITRMAGSKPTA